MIVRHATAEDLDALGPLFDAYRVFYGYSSDLPVARAYIAARMNGGDSTVLVAAESDELSSPVLGFTQLYPTWCSLELSRIFVVYDLIVSPAGRGRGVAVALMEAAREFGAANGAARLELATAHTNVPAQRLYEGLGWVLDTEYRHYELSLGPQQSDA